MATYSEIYDLRNSHPLKHRTVVAVAKAAQDVLNEDPETANHAARAVWAHAALLNAEAKAKEMLWGVCGNATIQSSGINSTDGDIQYVVNGLINTFAV